MYEIIRNQFLTIWGKPVIMAHRKGTNDGDVIHSVMFYDEYKARDFNYEDGDVFIDLGAHIGTWSILMGMLNPTFKVYSYEPIPENFHILQQNVVLNRLSNVKPFMLAVSSDSEGTESIYYTDDKTNYGKAHKFVGSMLGGTGTEVHIDKIALNDIFVNNNIEKCKMIKADCEGCEILGFSTLEVENLKKIKYVVGEFHPWTIDFPTFFSYFQPYFENISGHVEEGEVTPTSLQRFLFRRRKS